MAEQAREVLLSYWVHAATFVATLITTAITFYFMFRRVGEMPEGLPKNTIGWFQELSARQSSALSDSSTIISTTLVLSLAYFVLQLLVIYRQNRSMEKMSRIISDLRLTASTAQTDLLRSAQAQNFIAKQFQELESESSALYCQYFNMIRWQRDGKISEAGRNKVAIIHRTNDHLETICKTAASVIETGNGYPTGACSSNIKFISLRNGGGNEYIPAARSDLNNSQRRAQDNDFKRRPYWYTVEQNYYYKQIIDPNRDDYFVLDNINLLFKDDPITRRSAIQDAGCTEPTQDASRFYDTAIVFPIMGEPYADLGDTGGLGIRAFVEYAGSSIIGFLAVDAKGLEYKLGMDYNIDILRQLSTHTFNLIRAYDHAMTGLEERGDG